MITALTAGLLTGLLACGEAPPAKPAPPPMDLSKIHDSSFCDRYADPEFEGYCRLSVAAKPRIREPVDSLCGPAGPFEVECRRAWVAARIQPQQGYDMDTLLAACRDDSDCAFEVLDARGPEDVLAHAALCQARVPTYAEDCIRHALSIWWNRRHPDAAELARVSDADLPYPALVGRYVGTVIACDDIESECLGPEEAVAACQEALRDVAKRPSICEVVR
jgi:hypothetical protein